nr:MAG TPA: hypothetical protein [Caudoviricetes sp.]
MLTIINGLWWALLRRWFGGMLENYPILKNRGIQTTVMMLSMLPFFVDGNSNFMCWVAGLSIISWLQFVEISSGHGPIFDVSRGGNTPSEESVARYHKMWGFKILCRIFPESARYGFLFDFILLTIRYTLPMLPLAFISWGYVLIGLAVAPVYAFCWTLFERDSLLVCDLPESLNGPTKLAEAIWGFIFGFGLAVING